MKGSIFAILFLAITCTAAEHEYKTATLASQDSVSTGMHCSSGVLAVPIGLIGLGRANATCAQGAQRIYHVLVDGYDYVLQPDTRDPLAKVRPGDEFKYRLDDKNHLWTPDGLGNKATGFGKKMYEAKYNVLKIGPKQALEATGNRPTSSQTSVTSSVQTISPTPIARSISSETKQNLVEASPSISPGILGVSGANWEQGGVKGVEVLKVSTGSSAEFAGLQQGNIITVINSQRVSSNQELSAVLAQLGPGAKVSIGYLIKTQLGWLPKETTAILAREN